MDPQKLSQLDPKLRDAYQRVMGTVVPQAPTPAPAPQQPAPEPQPDAIPTPAPQPEPFFKPQPVTDPNPQPAPDQEAAIPQQPAAQNSNFVQMNSEIPAAAPVSTPNFTAPAPQAQSMAIKKKNGMILPIVFGIVGLIFVVIYTLFWTKIFNFKLPFLP